MAGNPRTRMIQQALKLGVKYGPLAYEGLKRGRGPAQDMVDKQLRRRNVRAAAIDHATHLIDGSVLPVYDGDTQVWVVFSGDTPVGSHPTVRTPLPKLLEHYDLGKRIRPDDAELQRSVRRDRGGPRLQRRRPATPGAARPAGSTDGNGSDGSGGAAGTDGTGRSLGAGRPPGGGGSARTA